MKRVGKRTRESAGGAKGLRCRAVVEEQAARRAGASDATGSIRTCEVRIPSNSVRCSVRTAWCRTASMHALALWAGSHFALPLHCRARPIRISNLSTQTVAQQAMGCQYGVWMGAAKADEARRRVRTSAIAPPCVPLEGGATIICATPERRACFERATEPWKSAKCRHCYTNSKCTHPAVLL